MYFKTNFKINPEFGFLNEFIKGSRPKPKKEQWTGWRDTRIRIGDRPINTTVFEEAIVLEENGIPTAEGSREYWTNEYANIVFGAHVSSKNKVCSPEIIIFEEYKNQ